MAAARQSAPTPTIRQVALQLLWPVSHVQHAAVAEVDGGVHKGVGLGLWQEGVGVLGHLGLHTNSSTMREGSVRVNESH